MTLLKLSEKFYLAAGCLALLGLALSLTVIFLVAGVAALALAAVSFLAGMALQLAGMALAGNRIAASQAGRAKGREAVHEAHPETGATGKPRESLQHGGGN